MSSETNYRYIAYNQHTIENWCTCYNFNSPNILTSIFSKLVTSSVINRRGCLKVLCPYIDKFPPPFLMGAEWLLTWGIIFVHACLQSTRQRPGAMHENKHLCIICLHAQKHIIMYIINFVKTVLQWRGLGIREFVATFRRMSNRLAANSANSWLRVFRAFLCIFRMFSTYTF